MTTADRLREKAKARRKRAEALQTGTWHDEEEANAVLLDLIADAWEAGSACADYCEDLVAMAEWRALLPRIEEIA